MIGAILAVAVGDGPVSGPLAADAGRVAAVDAVISSTTLEWSAVFEADGRSYASPRVVYLRVPEAHPARGSGYAPGLGLTIDLGDIDAIESEFGVEAPALIALIVAHEIGHHVQFLRDGRARRNPGPAREQQADCFAGWWLAQANARHALSQSAPVYSVPSLNLRIPQLLRLLSGTARGANADFAISSHGSQTDRAAAFGRGLAATTPADCHS